MTQYDYQWEFTGQSVNGYTGAQTNTSNEDIVIPATNEEAVQKFGAQNKMACKGMDYVWFTASTRSA